MHISYWLIRTLLKCPKHYDTPQIAQVLRKPVTVIARAALGLNSWEGG